MLRAGKTILVLPWVNLFRLRFLQRSPQAVEMRLVLLQCLNPFLSLAKA